MGDIYEMVLCGWSLERTRQFYKLDNGFAVLSIVDRNINCWAICEMACVHVVFNASKGLFSQKANRYYMNYDNISFVTNKQ